MQIQMQIQIIVNGAAKGFSDDTARDAFKARVADIVPHAQVNFTTPDVPVVDLVRQLVNDGATVVVAGGGDGTVNAVASVLVGTDTVLGVLALGTLNHFAKDIGVPLAVDDALAVLADGQVIRVDVGRVNERVFVNNSGLGLYPEMVARREEQQRRGASKWWAAFVESVRVLRRYRKLAVTLEIDGERLSRVTPAVFVGNNEYGTPTILDGQRERLDGGQLALYVPHPSTPWKLLWLCVRAFFGAPRHELEIETFVVRSFTLAVNARHPHVSIDGEVDQMHSPFQYESLPGALQVLVPKPAPEPPASESTVT